MAVPVLCLIKEVRTTARVYLPDSTGSEVKKRGQNTKRCMSKALAQVQGPFYYLV
jgi:hypothetical protein